MKKVITFLARRRFNYYDSIGTAMSVAAISDGNYVAAATIFAFWLAASIWAERYSGLYR